MAKEERVLKDLEHIQTYGGRLGARLETGAEESYYCLEGWKGTQSDPMHLQYTIGAESLEWLRDQGYIEFAALPNGQVELHLTTRGSRDVS